VVSPRNSWLLCAFVSLAIATYSNAQAVHFPGPESDARSPDRRYVIQNLDSNGTEPAHTLFLLDMRNGSKTNIHSYDRHVDILWSPQSDGFVINDYEASDSARPLLYSLPWGGANIDLLEKLTTFLRGQHQEQLVIQNDHVYLSVRRWINSRELLCRLEAYGDMSPHGAGFSGYYVYKIGEGFRKSNPNSR
jgi:hypothetical protein